MAFQLDRLEAVKRWLSRSTVVSNEIRKIQRTLYRKRIKQSELPKHFNFTSDVTMHLRSQWDWNNWPGEEKKRNHAIGDALQYFLRHRWCREENFLFTPQFIPQGHYHLRQISNIDCGMNVFYCPFLLHNQWTIITQRITQYWTEVVFRGWMRIGRRSWIFC